MIPTRWTSRWTYSWPRRRDLLHRPVPIRRTVLVWCRAAGDGDSEVHEPRH
jgi:hypothetical protein